MPGSINGHLRDYQRQGTAFLFQLYARASGGILADDMGLGKTVQVGGWVQPACGFLFQLYARASGGILADDMGLGKTVQVGWRVQPACDRSLRFGVLLRVISLPYRYDILLFIRVVLAAIL